MVDLTVGQKLKHRRSELNLSLRALGTLTDLSAAFLSQIECGKSNPSLKSLQKIANSLGVTLNYFLGERTEPINQHDQHRIVAGDILKGRQR
jgi:transcriptional regulator with XRE-family HTH domain